MSQIFISYARADDEPFVKKLYKDLEKQGLKVWWDRRAMESRGRTFLQEIRDAIAGVERLILVVGPKAAASQYVRAEWEFALHACKVITPILRLGELKHLPQELAKLHCPDFRPNRSYQAALKELTRILKDPLPPLAPLQGVDALPAHFLSRPEEVDRLGAAVLADISQPTIITSAKQTAALQGMGGIGKSVLAAAFARACQTRFSFGDGILWIKLGRQPDLVNGLRQAGRFLKDRNLSKYVDLQSSQAGLTGLLEEKNCLIILDDAWEVAHVEIFVNALGKRCRLLVTTRDKGLVNALGALELPLDVLGDAAALQMLADWCGKPIDDLPREAEKVCKECGNLPFALALCGALVRDGNTWADLLEALQDTDLAFIEKQLPNYPYSDVLRSMRISVEALARIDPGGAQRYLELAVFPGGRAVPEAAVMTLWLRAEGLQERQARRLLATLENKALLRLEGAAPHRRMSLHDLQHDYLKLTRDDLPGLHQEMLNAYQQQCGAGWHSGPRDGYFFEHLAYHLLNAGQKKALRLLLLDFRWLQARLEATDINGLIADYDGLPEAQELRLIQDALRLSAHVLIGDKAQLTSQLWSRLMQQDNPAISALLQDAAVRHAAPWLKPLTIAQSPAGTPLLRTLKGEMNCVNAVSVSPDETMAICGDDSGMIRIWDILNGVVRHTLDPGVDWITCSAMHPQKPLAVLGSGDGHILLVDLKSGSLIGKLQADKEDVNDVAVSADGRWIASAHDGGCGRIWNLENGTCTRKLETDWDKVEAIDFSGDAQSVFLGDEGLQQWDVLKGKPVCDFKIHPGSIESLRVSPDGRWLAAGFADGTIQLWELAKLSDPHTVSGHQGLLDRNAVSTLQFTPDGTRLVSGSWDETLKVWNVADGEELWAFAAHSSSIYDLDVYAGGSRVITSSKDTFLKIWDLTRPADISLPEKHAAAVDAVAVAAKLGIAVSGSRDRHIKIWDLQRGELLRTLTGHKGKALHEGWVADVAIDPQKQQIISIGKDQKIHTWDIGTGKNVFTVHGDWNTYTDSGLALAADGSVAISTNPSYFGKSAAVWKPGRQRKLRAIKAVQEDGVSAVSPDGRLAVIASFEGGIYVIDLKTFSVTSQLQSRQAKEDGLRNYINKIALSAEGRFAVMGFRDGPIDVWDVLQNKLLRTLQFHGDEVTAVAITPDGKLAASSSWEGRLYLWEVATGKIVAGFSGDEVFAACAIAPDAKMIVAGDEGGNVHFLRIEGV